MITLIASFVKQAIIQGIPLLYGSTGEIITEKSGNLNLGIPGVMYIGGISGVIGAYFYESYGDTSNGFLCVLVPFLSSVLGSLIMSLIYSFLTITLRANQNVTGLALTTFGVGVGNFFGGSLSSIFGEGGQIALNTTGNYFKQTLPFADNLGLIGDTFFSFGFLAYLSFAISLFASYVLGRTRIGLNLKAVGENPATADAAGINVTLYKYLATCIGGGIAGLGGLYFIMDYIGGAWTNNGFGDRGWLAIALVIFAIWKPKYSIFGSILFGGLYIVYLYIPGLMRNTQEIFKVFPYMVTILVLILTSIRKKREHQPPASLGLPYFREER
ncbi:MAG: Branched-chain amino acid transport system / permease component [Firmicutes bacterium ADurb.Bin300]|nr:MAG: Branched-chain amino acid transport system / permease component [Firmicutes bacterium ADurb.Bin300]